MNLREAADRDYANAAHIPGGMAYPARWSARAAAFRQDQEQKGARLGRRSYSAGRYGPGGRQCHDLFLPDGPPRGLFVFVHGGYWLDFDQEYWSHLAAGPLARGWAVAMPGYTLAPAARLGEITVEIVTALISLQEIVPGPVVVAGHSAGGHLAARMGCADVGPGFVRRVVPISPLAELAPLMATSMNDRLGIDEAEAAAESPARLARRAGVEAHVWVGGQERPAFLWQARTLAETWGCDWTVDPGRHHFDVIDGLEKPDSPLTRACLDGL